MKGATPNNVSVQANEIAEAAVRHASKKRWIIAALTKSLSQVMTEDYGMSFRYTFNENPPCVYITPDHNEPALIRRSDLREAV